MPPARPLRAGLFLALLILITALMGLAYAPTLLLGRRHAVAGFRHWTRVNLALLRILVGIRHEVAGREHLPAGPVLIASKHQAMWDTLVFTLLLEDPAYVLKSELLSVPVYGWYAVKLGMIPVDRGGSARALRRMMRAARAVIAEGRPIVIYPEGTRMAPGTQGTLKPGIAALYRDLGVACVPVGLDSGAYWPRRGWAFRPGVIRIAFGAPIPPGLGREAFMARLGAALQDLSSPPRPAGAPAVPAAPCEGAARPA